MTLSPGTRLGPYEILARLGAGGMGEVYRARDTRLDRTVAVKVLLPGRSMSPELRQRFEREARAVSSLGHPNICTLHDVGHQDGIDFLVLEYVEGETLADRLNRGPLPLDQALRHAIEIADALAAAHGRGVVHRDLKPGNVMLTKAGAKLLDFGLAKMTASAAGVSPLTAAPTLTGPLTEEGAIVGTLYYMAPEQLEGREADARTDIFALGAMTYEMVTGTRGFEGKSRAGVIAAILSSEPQPISNFQPSAPPALDRLIRLCLAKDPDERWQNARDLVAELEWIAEGGMDTAVAPSTTRFRHRERLAWAMAVAVVSVVALALWLAHLRRPIQDARPVRLSVIPPQEGGTIEEAVLSPDGRWLAFTASTTEGKRLLWLRALDSTEAKPLPGTEDARTPFWSPDSRFLAFFAGRMLQKIEMPVGRIETLCDAPAGFRGTWNREGTILFGNLSSQGILRVSATGGQPTPVTWPSASLLVWADLHPFFLPDGRHFLFLRGGASQENVTGIYIGSLDSRESQRLLPDYSSVAYAPPGYLLFVRGGSLVAQPFDASRLRLMGEPVPIADPVAEMDFGYFIFSVANTGVLAYRSANPNSRLVWVDRRGRSLGSVGEPADWVHVDLSPDDTRAVLERIEPQSRNHEVWLLDMARGTPSRFTFTGFNCFPIWSPDGSRIAYASIRDDQFELYAKLANGVGKEEALLASKDLEKWPSSWSPDGQYIVFEGSVLKESPDLWVLQLSGERRAAPFEKTATWDNSGQISPDGRWLAYYSGESEPGEVYVQSFPTPGNKWQVSTGGGFFPRWRRDGKELFFVTSRNQLMAVEVSADAAFHAGAPRPLFVLNGAKRYKNRFPYAVSHDGQRFLVNVEDSSLSTVTAVLDWTAAVERK